MLRTALEMIVLAVVLTVFSCLLYRYHSETIGLQRTVKTAETYAKTLEDRAKQAEETLAKERENALKQALESNKDWADSRLPDDVVRVLQGNPSNCPPSSGTSQHSRDTKQK